MVWSWLTGNVAMWIFAVSAIAGGISLTFPSSVVSDWLHAKLSDNFSVEMLVGVLLLVNGGLAVWSLLVG